MARRAQVCHLRTRSGVCATPSVAAGSITNDALLSHFELHLDAIVSALDEADFVELTKDAVALGRRTEDPDS